MKIGILTITNGQNYGNRLQNYAMQQILKTFGADAETIQHPTSRDPKGIQKVMANIKYGIKRFLGFPCGQYRRIRKKRFEEFNKQYITFSKYVLKSKSVPEELEEYFDCFVVGSDQVWNARFDIIQEDVANYLAAFAHKKQKIAYAASFGTNDIAPGYENVFARYLPMFKALSVREDSGVDIIQKICGRNDVSVVLDPVMMLEAEEWKQIANKPHYIEQEPFLVTYFLGGREPATEMYIKTIAGQYKCRVINLDIEFLQDDRIEDKEIFATTPDEFVWLICNAQCVLTDSFHATAFAILFYKPFCVFERKMKGKIKGNNMGSRIETLLGKFDLMQFYDDIMNPTKFPEMYDIDNIERILSKERNKSIQFLRKALIEE